MRNLLAILIACFIVPMGCTSDQCTLIVENRTGSMVKEIHIYVQNSAYSVQDIKPYAKTELEIQTDSIILNNHDLRIATTHKNKNGVVIEGFYYTDLSGHPKPDYRIEIYDAKTVIR